MHLYLHLYIYIATFSTFQTYHTAGLDINISEFFFKADEKGTGATNSPRKMDNPGKDREIAEVRRTVQSASL